MRLASGLILDQGLSSWRYDFFTIALSSLGGVVISLLSPAGELGVFSSETSVATLVSESFLRLYFL